MKTDSNKKEVINGLPKVTKRQLQVELLMLIVLATICFFVVRQDYLARPGIINEDSLTAIERTSNSITLQWQETRNTKEYVILYKRYGKKYKTWNKETVSSSNDKLGSVKIGELYEGTKYSFILRPDNDKRDGFHTERVVFSTKIKQNIIVRKKNVTKLFSQKKYRITGDAHTELSYKSSNIRVASVNEKTGKVKFKKPGQTTITITAKETDEYTSARTKVRMLILGDVSGKSSGASAKTIYYLNSENCTPLFSVKAAGCPQSLAYTGEKYIIGYNQGFSGVITYSKKGKLLNKYHSGALGHANGMTYSNTSKRCYIVRGNSHSIDIFNPNTGGFGSTSIFCSGSGLGYDRVKDVIYLSSRTGIRAFSADGSFSHLKIISNVDHGKHVYTQDCCGHGGIVIRCISGSNKRTENYLDLYDFDHASYLGSLLCNIGEVESAIVDDDGYLELLINNSDDYIWKTPINIDSISE